MAKSEWCLKLMFIHPLGQAVALELMREGKTWLVALVYAPNIRREREELWVWLLSKLERRDILICRDLNHGDEELS